MIDTEYKGLSQQRAKEKVEGYGKRTFSAAPAFATANETPKMALAPSLPLFGVPSRSIKNLSIVAWSLTSKFFAIKAGAMVLLTLLTALRTPLPPHLDLSPSRSSIASCWPIFF